MRTKPRQTLAPGVYRDHKSIEIRATSNGETLVKRLPPDTTAEEAIRERAYLVQEVQEQHPRPERHTLAFDVPVYLNLQRHLVNHRTLTSIMAAWVRLLGTVPRHRITRAQILECRNVWLENGRSPKTVNDRVAALRHLYHLLDGKRAVTPCDDIAKLPVARTPIRRVSDALILKVDAALQRREQDPTKAFDGAKTRARFRVLVSTGRRPSEVMRAEKTDVDLKNRVWVVRDGKGGWSPGIYLNHDMLAAWKLFIKANAWGPYNHGNFGRVIRKAGWPANVKPYQARHTTWITAAERGADLADIQIGAGHKDLKTTRLHYTGVRHSRMQKLSEGLDGRFKKFPSVGARVGAAKHTRHSARTRAR